MERAFMMYRPGTAVLPWVGRVLLSLGLCSTIGTRHLAPRWYVTGTRFHGIRPRGRDEVITSIGLVFRRPPRDPLYFKMPAYESDCIVVLSSISLVGLGLACLQA